jgi:hypothetical protein
MLPAIAGRLAAVGRLSYSTLAGASALGDMGRQRDGGTQAVMTMVGQNGMIPVAQQIRARRLLANMTPGGFVATAAQIRGSAVVLGSPRAGLPDSTA